jgi:ribonucleoside-diphosphate reductase alpha chain
MKADGMDVQLTEKHAVDGFENIEAPKRQRLPDTRWSLTHKFSVDGQEGYIIVGLFDDGRPGEVFIKMAKQGSTISGLTDTVGVLTSIALQHGVPIDLLARKFEYMRFEPSGWTSNDEIRQAHSVTDYIFRWLGLQFSVEYRAQREAIYDRSTTQS